MLTANMGLGTLSDSGMMFGKRKYRWTLEWLTPSGELIVPESFVKISARPNISIDGVSVTNNSQQYWIPGKSSWESITATYFDTNNDEGGALMAYWLAQQYQRESNEPLKIDLACAVLKLYDGVGFLLETWELDGAMVIGYSFGDLDYSSDDQQMEVTIRYSDVHYTSNVTFSQEQKSVPSLGLPA